VLWEQGRRESAAEEGSCRAESWLRAAPSTGCSWQGCPEDYLMRFGSERPAGVTVILHTIISFCVKRIARQNFFVRK